MTINKNRLKDLTNSFISSGGIFFLLILILGIVLRIPRFNESLWHDELWSTSTVLKNFYSVAKLSLTDIHPPFYPFFMFYWIKIFGDSEIAVRMPSFIFGMGSIFLTYLITLKYIGKRTALLTTFLLCASPVHIWYSQEARAYSGTMFFLLVAIFSYYKIQELNDNKNKWYLVYAISLFSAVFYHFFMIIYPILISIICFIRTKKDQWTKKILKINGLIILLFMFFMFAKILAKSVVFREWYLSSFTISELFKLFFDWFLLGNSLWNKSYWVPETTPIGGGFLIICANIFFLFIFIHGLILLYKKRKVPFNLDVILYLFVLPVTLIFISLIGFKQIYIKRSLFACLPFFLIIFAQGTNFRFKYTRILSTTVVVMFSIAALIGYFQKSDRWTVHHPNSDWRSAAIFFSNEIKNGKEPVGIIFEDEWKLKPLLHYLKREKIYYGKQVKLLDYDSEIEEIALVTDKADVLYFIKGSLLSDKEVDEYLKQLKKDLRMQLLDTKTFKGLTVYKLTIKN